VIIVPPKACRAHAVAPGAGGRNPAGRVDWAGLVREGSKESLLGRVTYQGFAQAWPSMGTDEFGQRLNSIPKYVVSSTLADDRATWGEPR